MSAPLLPLLLCLLLASPVAGAQGVCGDCNGSGALSILDALAVSQIAVGLSTPSASGLCTCDVDGNAMIGVVDALLVAQRSAALPALLDCGAACPPDYTVMRCGGVDLANPTITDHDLGAVANFDVPGTTVFYAVPSPPPGMGVQLQLSGMSPPANLDLYLGRPGVVAGDRASRNYTAVLGLTGSSPELHFLDCAEVARYGGFPIPVVVHSVVAGGTFDLSVECMPSVCPQSHADIPCGLAAPGSFTGVQSCAGCPAPWPPDLAAGPATVAFFALPIVAPDVTRIELRLEFAAGDLDLLLADPGVPPADIDFANYSRYSVTLQPERLVIDAQSMPPISDYHGLPLGVVVTAYDGTAPLAYSLHVDCLSAAGVTLVPCDYLQLDIGTVVAGTAPGAADLAVPGSTQFFGITGLPAEATHVEIQVRGMSVGTDLDLLVGLPTTAPGDADVGHYAFRSETVGSGDELVVLDCPALYERAGLPIAVAVHGRSPGEFDFRVVCSDLPCACSSLITATWSGGCLDPGSPPVAVEDRYSFFANVGETIELQVDTYDNETTFDPAVALFAPGGMTPIVIATTGAACREPPISGDCPVLAAVASTSGLYHLGVKSEGEFGPAGIGNYVVSARVAGYLVPLAIVADDVPEGW